MKAFNIICLALALAACASEERLPLEAQSPHKAKVVAHARPATPRRPLAAPAKPAVQSAGALQTAMVGDYMDAQEKDLRAHLRPTGALVARVGDDLTVSWRNDMLFDGDGLSGRGTTAIEQLAELLRHYDHSVIQVSGFFDTAGTPTEALERSRHHAKAIADNLVADGVSSERVTSQGFGATHLKIVTGPGKNEARNRRIEVRIVAHPQA
jgi:outer membrane protein OmpA-like peptidoglycan-associated protein